MKRKWCLFYLRSFLWTCISEFRIIETTTLNSLILCCFSQDMMCQFSKFIEICLFEAHWLLSFFSFALTPQESINLPFHCNCHPCCLPPSYSQSAPPTVLPPLGAEARMERKFSFTSLSAFVKQNCGKSIPSGCWSDGMLLKCFQQSFFI